MGYTLWGEPDSGSFMIEAALAEAEQPVELVDLDLTKDEQRGDRYLQINPAGKIPALRFPDGELMTQSAAILLALDEAHPAAGLMPPPASPDRRSALRWLIYVAAEIYPLVEMSDYPHRFAPPGDLGHRHALVGAHAPARTLARRGASRRAAMAASSPRASAPSISRSPSSAAGKSGSDGSRRRRRTSRRLPRPSPRDRGSPRSGIGTSRANSRARLLKPPPTGYPGQDSD